ncbi:TonB-dependent receptor [Chitinimonas koreensis]|uniref:TonB-dependent receptor n=1 Tax=Chitinimonas koreensis TaxID=356302 RepID=UPI0004231D5D|nr:TonB-dependent receptor [Chitinimonas koreensis]
MIKPHILSRSIALALAGLAHAADAVQERIEVVAKPIVEDNRIDDYAASSAVIGERQLRDLGAVDLASALRRAPGVQISRYNPVGAFGGDQGGAVFVRGLGLSRPGSEIKTYIDGVPFYMGLWNHPLLDLLPINGMRSVTVYKSPQPAVSGNNFAAVDLRAKRALEDGLHGAVRLSAGSFDTVVEQAELQGKHGDVDFSLAQGYARSDGHRSHADGELKNLMARVGLRLDAHWRLEAGLVQVDNRAGDPGDERLASPAVAPRYDTEATLLSSTLRHAHGDWQGELRLYRSRGEGNWLDQPAPDGDTYSDFRLSGLRWQERFSPWSGGELLAGIDLDRMSGEARFARVAPAPASRFEAPDFRIDSPYLALSQRMALDEDWLLQPSAGVRHYRHSDFGSETAPQAGLALISKRLTLFANASRGVNYPGLETPLLASLIPPLGQSWKQLDAERLDHAEVGFKFSPDAATQLDLSLFQDEVKNRYVFGFPPEVPPPPQFINLGAYRMHGVELSLRQALGTDWTLFAGLTLLDPSIDHLPYSPRRSATLGLNGQLGGLRLAFDAQYQSEVWALNRARAAGAVNAEQVAGFAVANVRVAYPLAALGRQGELFLDLENLFDRRYGYRPGYPMPGRWGRLGLAAGF